MAAAGRCDNQAGMQIAMPCWMPSPSCRVRGMRLAGSSVDLSTRRATDEMASKASEDAASLPAGRPRRSGLAQRCDQQQRYRIKRSVIDSGHRGWCAASRDAGSDSAPGRKLQRGPMETLLVNSPRYSRGNEPTLDHNLCLIGHR